MAMVTPRNGRKIPLLPGYMPTTDPAKTSYPKRQTLNYSLDSARDTLKPQLPPLDLADLKTMLDVSNRYDMSKPSLTHDERKATARNTYRPAIAPNWLKHDRQVLRYYAYYQEPVHESPNENFRIRRCVILLYLEDSTMQICEPKVENSGIPQGTMVKRHRIPRPDHCGGGSYGVADLKCGAELFVYAKIFKIIGMDKATTSFYEKEGMDPGVPEEQPEDAFSAAQTANSGKPTAAGGSLSITSARDTNVGVLKEVADGKEYAELCLGGNRKNTKLAQFLANDRKVLCFSCFWDDPTRYGSRQYFTLHYFLSDDTAELLEDPARNTGRDPYPVFCRRAPLVKNPVTSATPGMLQPEPELYTPTDFIVGEPINVFGRSIFIYGCDDFTRDFYKKYAGIEQPRVSIEEPQRVHVQLSYPPHTGIGSEEDSLATCLNLRQKPPKKDMKKLMGLSDVVMRFEAVMDNGSPEDLNRRFVIGVFMGDDTVGVWETRQRNSGHTEGKFAERSKKRSATGEWLKPADFVVGEVVSINATPFRIVKADDATLKLMAARPEMFPAGAPEGV